MEFGLMTEPQLGMTYEELADAARFAEEIGLDVFARSDHYGFDGFATPHATDAFASLGGLAIETERIGLCVLVSPITFRHPAVIAKTAATIHEMSGGRLALGVGTGWMEHEHRAFGIPFPEWPERYERFEEALGYLRAAFGKDPNGFDGDHYALRDTDVRPPAADLPLVVGGTGPKRTPRIAGTYADEYNMVFMPADEMSARIDRARRAAADAGRDPGALRISVMAGGVVGRTEASYRANLERVAAAHPMGRTAAQIEESLRGRGLPVGAGGEAREAVAAMAAAGIDRYYLQHLGPFDHDLLEETFDTLRA
jgi:alkanesulfonate monooxygenase SsuD/methylene tetrahydromethanopterin reductase-like flavin-dependent oxidoreductase (luciferase family)